MCVSTTGAKNIEGKKHQNSAKYSWDVELGYAYMQGDTSTIS